MLASSKMMASASKDDRTKNCPPSSVPSKPLPRKVSEDSTSSNSHGMNSTKCVRIPVTRYAQPFLMKTNQERVTLQQLRQRLTSRFSFHSSDYHFVYWDASQEKCLPIDTSWEPSQYAREYRKKHLTFLPESPNLTDKGRRYRNLPCIPTQLDVREQIVIDERKNESIKPLPYAAVVGCIVLPERSKAKTGSLSRHVVVTPDKAARKTDPQKKTNASGPTTETADSVEPKLDAGSSSKEVKEAIRRMGARKEASPKRAPQKATLEESPPKKPRWLFEEPESGPALDVRKRAPKSSAPKVPNGSLPAKVTLQKALKKEENGKGSSVRALQRQVGTPQMAASGAAAASMTTEQGNKTSKAAFITIDSSDEEEESVDETPSKRANNGSPDLHQRPRRNLQHGTQEDCSKGGEPSATAGTATPSEKIEKRSISANHDPGVETRKETKKISATNEVIAIDSSDDEESSFEASSAMDEDDDKPGPRTQQCEKPAETDSDSDSSSSSSSSSSSASSDEETGAEESSSAAGDEEPQKDPGKAMNPKKGVVIAIDSSDEEEESPSVKDHLTDSGKKPEEAAGQHMEEKRRAQKKAEREAEKKRKEKKRAQELQLSRDRQDGISVMREMELAGNAIDEPIAKIIRHKFVWQSDTCAKELKIWALNKQGDKMTCTFEDLRADAPVTLAKYLMRSRSLKQSEMKCHLGWARRTLDGHEERRQELASIRAALQGDEELDHSPASESRSVKKNRRQRSANASRRTGKQPKPKSGGNRIIPGGSNSGLSLQCTNRPSFHPVQDLMSDADSDDADDESTPKPKPAKKRRRKEKKCSKLEQGRGPKRFVFSRRGNFFFGKGS